jgi:sulfotransferase
MSSPIAEMLSALLRTMSGANEFAFAVSDEQRSRVALSVFEAFYRHLEDKHVVFDTSRAWCSLSHLVNRLIPNARILCCVRNPAWILDSIERQVQSNALEPSRMFRYDTMGTVYSRVDSMQKNFLGGPLAGLQQAWFGECSNRLIAIRYESLTTQPCEVIRRLYEILEEKPYSHNFERIEFEEPHFDKLLGLPGLHTVRPCVEAIARKTILPPDLFEKHNNCFWETSEGERTSDVLTL